MLSATALSCASVYDYHYRASSHATPDIQAIARRVADVREPEGFKRFAFTKDDMIPQVGDTGYLGCPDAGDLIVFLRERYRARYGRTSVHLYACQGEVRVVTLADSWVQQEPARTSELLSRVFADDLAKGVVIIDHRHRLAVE